MPGTKVTAAQRRLRLLARGTPNKATQEVRELARGLVEDPDYRAKLKARLEAGQAGPLEPLLWHYGFGKPKEVVEIPGLPEVITLRWPDGRGAGRRSREDPE